ncbi:MAG: SBBP repeat-containing protein, partial [Bryobacteraceae bacterium]
MRRGIPGAAVFLAVTTVIGSKPVRPGSDAVTANPTPIVFSTYFGGSFTDVASAIAVDAGGNTYVTGWTSSTDLPVKNAFQSHSGGGVDAFVAKFDSTGALAYCTYLGGEGDDRAFGIAVDASGTVYLTGWTSSTDFPTAGNPYQGSLAGGLDAFFAKLSASGESLVYSTFLGGASSDQGRGIALDASGNAFIAGQTASSSFPTLHPLQSGLKGPQDAFVAEFDGSGALLFSTYLGGSGTDTAAAIAVGGDGSLYLTGSTDSLDFPTLNALQPANAGYQDAFVTKLSFGGAAIVFSTYLGGSGGAVDYPESGLGIDVDAAGNAYVVGVTSSSDFPTRNALQPALAGWENAFVTKVAATGTALDFSTYLGGSNLDYGVALRVDSSGAACVAGYSTSPDFPLLSPVQSGLAGSYDAFLSCLSASGEALVFSTLLGGSNADAAYGLAMDAGSVYIAGLTASSDFPLKNAFQSLNTAGKISAFVARLTRYQTAPPPAPVPTFPGNGAVNVPLSPTLTWNASSGAASYAINLGSSPSPPLLADTTNLAYGPGTLAAGTTYYWQVTASNSAGSSSSAVFSFTTACTYGIGPASAAPGAAAASGSVMVTAPAGCAWTASSSDTSWLTVTSGSSGSGSGTVNYAATANPNGTARIGILTIAELSFTVTQAGVACTYALGALSSASWLTVTSGSSGSGSGTVNYSVTANSAGPPRTGTLTIAGQSFTVTQAGINPAGCIFYLDGVSGGFPDAGGSGQVHVTLGSVEGCSWVVSSDSTWITITSASAFTASGNVLYSVAANTTGVTRTGTLTIAGQTFTVTQVAGCSFTLSSSSAS